MPNVHTLGENVDFTQSIPPADRGSGVVTTQVYTSMLGYEGGMFLIDIGSMQGLCTLNGKVIMGSDSAGGGSAYLTSSDITEVAAASSNTQVGISFRTTQLTTAKPFVGLGLSTEAVGGVGAALIGATLIRYRARNLPVTTSLTELVVVP